jgi:hypothetical protein
MIARFEAPRILASVIGALFFAGLMISAAVPVVPIA